ncbi:AAA domain-containing protein [Janthinobacterium sp. NFX145]|uniref:AAA domain-containing protein n=1 Tax=Janthinobacterium sp. NFX145 TaxID=3415602 RepID=UPI003CC6CEBE
MKINYLSSEGVLEVEQGAMREIERRLSSNWIGYAAFQLIQRGSFTPLDLDLVVLTNNRILIVELKNWSGDIQYSNSQWFHKGVGHKSPVQRNNNKARVLREVLRTKHPKLISPIVESLVVLCHPQCRLQKFPEEERKFVLTLNEFCETASKPAKYKERFPEKPTGMTYPSANPLPDRAKYDGFFSLQNPQVLQRRTVLHGFEQVSTTPDYIHPKTIWSEYRAEHIEVRRSKALMRKWDFGNLAAGGTSALERATIGLREMRLNEALRAQAPDLHADLLEPVVSATADDVTTNFVEAYRLPDRVERIAELLARRPDMDAAERVSLAKSVLSRFSKLHVLGIAHRDITTKTLWVVEPSRVILSSFAAAFAPETRTVGVHRIELETGSIALPEDSKQQRSVERNAPFARDVFLLGVLLYELIEGIALERVDSVPLFDDNRALVLPLLLSWYTKALDWEPKERFSSASDALDAFNACLITAIAPTVSEGDISTFGTTASIFTLPQKSTLQSSPGKTVYISERNGEQVLVKCWPSLRYDVKHPMRNGRLLEFLHQARSLRQSGFDAAPEVLDFGISDFGLILVTRWEHGDTLGEWLKKEPSPRSRAAVALSLLNAVRRFHAIGLAHGDLKGANVVISEDAKGAQQAILLDVPDLSADGDICVTVGILPPHLEAAAPQHRDLFVVAQLALALLDETEFPRSRREAQRAAALTESLPPIDLLTETIQSELFPAAASSPSFKVTLRRKGQEPISASAFEGDNASFPVGVQLSADRNVATYFVSGLRQQLIIKYHCQAQSVSDVFVKEIGHEAYVISAKRAQFKLHANIQLEFGREVEGAALAEALHSRYVAVQEDSQDGESVKLSSASDPYLIDGDVGSKLGAVSASDLWSALANTDELNATKITVRPGARKASDGTGDWLLPFDVEEGVLDFSEDERIELIERGTDPLEGTERWYTVGAVSSDIGKDLMRVSSTNMRFTPRENMILYLRGAQERYASERRVAAMRRVLGNGALIPRIPEYFDPELGLTPRRVELPALGSLADYELNPEQEEALLNCLTVGPISLLQGPPGTGKTKFIASFVHLALNRGIAKNILLVSQSHEAVNNALEKVADLAGLHEMDVSMVRVGLPSMVSPRLRGIHEDSRRQLYRESFDAELKERVKAVGYSMGLPRSYVDLAIEVHVTLGSILERIIILEKDASQNGVTDDGHSLTQAHRLKEVFCEIASAKFSLDASPHDDLPDVFAKFLADAEFASGSPSPEKCQKLEQVVRLSSEFSSVLRNPRSNFTSFLSRSASVVAGTCVGIGKHALGIVDHAYDWVIVDEAARASPMELVVAMQSGRRVLLVGDHLQLPPIYPIAVEEKTSQILGVSRSDFRRLNNFKRAFASEYGKQVGRTLLSQYRMADSISQLVSKCFYEGALKVARAAPGNEYNGLPAYMQKQLVWVDTSDQGRRAFHSEAETHDGALFNEIEANAVVAVMRDIAKSPEFLLALREKLKPSEVAIGIIAMYASQRDLIRKKLDQADWASEIRDFYTVGTVDSYQGKENRIIIVSVVRNDTERSVGFLHEPERINVGLSRAKDRLVIVSSTSMWSGRTGMPMKTVLDEFSKMEGNGTAQMVMSLELKGEKGNA